MFRFLLNFIGFLLSFVFTEKIMHEVWHLRNVIYSSIVRCHFKSIGKGGRFCYPLILNGGKNILIGDKFSLRERGRIEAIDLYQGVNYTPSIIIGDNVGIGMASHERIDEINILQATYEAMRQAIKKLDPAPDLTLNDAVTIPGVDIKQVPIIKGDAKSISIGAASIVAKVTRDRMMVEYDRIYPGYGFASNKGYGSAEHIKALKEIGPSPIHRASFIHNFI